MVRSWFRAIAMNGEFGQAGESSTSSSCLSLIPFLMTCSFVCFVGGRSKGKVANVVTIG